MPANLYDYANQFTLGQLGGAGKGLLQGAADMLNRYGIGTHGIKTAKPQRQSERPVGTQAVLGGKPVYWGGDNYGWQQLNQTGTSATLNALNSPGALAAFTGTGSSPAERAYQTERSRVAQLTAQDPELQRYEAARKLAVAPGATPEQVKSAEDVGMQIWAQKYGKTLAPKVKPGQAGYDVIQRTLYPGGTPAPALPAESEAMLNAIAPVNEFGVRPNVTPMPGQLPSFGSATEAMFNEVTGGGSLVTPMPQTAQTPQTQAQDLAEAYKQAMLARVLSNK